MTVYAASCFCHFSLFPEVACLYFLLTQVIIFSFLGLDGVEDQIIIVNNPLISQLKGILSTKFGLFMIEQVLKSYL